MSQTEQQVFGGRYELIRHVARGGMAEVYLAHDQMLDRRVALKVLFRELSTDRSFVERFRREAQAAANLSHPNIVSVYDWGEEDGTYFIVMEYVEGRTLGQVIRSEGPLLADRVADIGAEVAAALAFAHRSGVVHRDVKPGNVLLSPSGQVKVTDFGIARAANTEEALTQTGAVMGTATYFSPEQAQGHTVDARSDLYSLGVVLYEAVVGRPPFAGDNPMTIAYKHVREEPRTPREVNPDVPPQFEAIVLQAMTKNPADRYASAEELRADLLRFRQGRMVLANPTVMAPAYDAGATAAVPAYDDRTQTVTSTTRPPTAPPPRQTGAFVVLLFVLLAILAGLLYLFARQTGIIGEPAAARVQVPFVVGKTAEEATDELEAVGLKAIRQIEASEAEAGTVFAQSPDALQTVDKGSSVVLRVSAGAEKVKLPNVVGQDITRATDVLEGLGLAVDPVDKADTTVPKGQVIDQNPDAGVEVAKGSSVELTVSSGKAQKTVPNVSGMAADDAHNRLVREGFNVTRKSEASSTVPEGDVIRTDPAGGAKADEGATVTMFVSSGQADTEQTTVPNLVGRTEEQARSDADRAGLRMVVAGRVPSDQANDGRVVSQSPAGGTRVDKGSTVTVRIGQFGIGNTTSTTS